MSFTIYHNPRCSKSRQGLQLLHDRGIKAEIIEYLKTPPSVEEMDRILKLLGLEPRELMRRKENEYKDLDLADESKDRSELIQAMVENPRLIERPIVVAGDKAALGRPPENILELL
ncbi:MAG: arsenate reductase (glutaredoxin) [bacterium]|nr:arsenate reductase (glutaredoxin) [bacterium]